MNMRKMINEEDIDRQSLYIRIVAHQIDHSPCKTELRTLLLLLCEPRFNKSDNLRQKFAIGLSKYAIRPDEP